MVEEWGEKEGGWQTAAAFAQGLPKGADAAYAAAGVGAPPRLERCLTSL
jgi:hypothetical protein